SQPASHKTWPPEAPESLRRIHCWISWSCLSQLTSMLDELPVYSSRYMRNSASVTSWNSLLDCHGTRDGIRYHVSQCVKISTPGCPSSQVPLCLQQATKRWMPRRPSNTGK